MPESRSQRRARVASYIPLRVTATLRCGVISDGWLPFDAILYYAQHAATLIAPRVATVPRARTVQEDADAATAGTLPLKRLAGDTPHWYHAASCAVWPSHVADGIDYWSKRLDQSQVDLLAPAATRAKIPISGGPYRGYRMPVHYRHALSLTWYCVGDPARIVPLLRLVRGLGKKTAHGWGRVIAWDVQASPEDWSVTGPDGRLMRPIPSEDPAAPIYGLRPPYWLPRHQQPCRLPERA